MLANESHDSTVSGVARWILTSVKCGNTAAKHLVNLGLTSFIVDLPDTVEKLGANLRELVPGNLDFICRSHFKRFLEKRLYGFISRCRLISEFDGLAIEFCEQKP